MIHYPVWQVENLCRKVIPIWLMHFLIIKIFLWILRTGTYDIELGYKKNMFFPVLDEIRDLNKQYDAEILGGGDFGDFSDVNIEKHPIFRNELDKIIEEFSIQQNA